MLFPKSWPVVLLFGSLAMSVVYALFGSGIYYYIGDGGSIANVPYQHPYNPLTIATYPFILFHAIIMVPIYFYVISFDWETAFNMHRIVVARRAVSLKILRIALRSCLWLGVLFCAVVIPRSFAVFNTLSIFSSSFALYIIPAACYLHLYGWRSCNIVEKIGSVVVIFVGISTLIFGTLGSLLYVLYGSRSNPQF
ncbi:hypothetical protein AX774_g8186 [Zancudomyces culisetae]|uniref:Amino acid transporter transmembrane domain-containing protein n=1 Tax=Zancudomyces culisetae TaxID=1213189 RepID=A0A1R1PBR9_ZANCU|nr:hypothetical protein AX774_g8186 [Zancudomyces culisetae]|eukprot:OMH78425.1 hypothetical protein AX774_g8186 [Zancudomyces culisetae]